MSKRVTVAGVTAAPGKKAYGVLTVPDLMADGQSVEVPFVIINGAKDGPRLHIQVAQHGSEVYALEGIRRVLADIDPEKLSGVITFCLPNPVAFRERVGTTPMDPIPGGMNRIWPGDPNGSLTERIAHAIWVNLIKGIADYVIDNHGIPLRSFVFYEAHGISPGVPKEVAEKSEKMAMLYGCEYVEKETESYGGGKTCRGLCVDHGIPAIVPEIAVGDTDLVERGHRNIMVDLGMIDGEIKLPPKQYVLKWVIDPKAAAVRTNKGGCFIPSVKMGDIVKKGEKVGIMYSPRTLEETETLTAPRDGYVTSIPANPVKHAGESVMQIAEILGVIENR